MALALTAYEDGLCPHCGQPRDRAWNEDMEGHYIAHQATCVACQAREQATDGKKISRADSVYVVDDSPVGFVPDPRMVTDRKV